MSTYDELLAGARHQAELFRQEAERFHGYAKDYIPQMCEALEKEKNHTKEDIRDRVMKDCLDIWGRTTIEKHIPTEYKDPINRSNRLGKKKHKEESVSQYDDSLSNNHIEEKKPMEITTTGEIDRLNEELENVKREVYDNNTVSETIQQEPIEPESLPPNTVLPNELYEQLQEKDKKIDELRKGIQQSLVDKVNSRAQQEEIDQLKKQLQEARKMSENDIRVVEIDFQKFAGFVNECQSKEKPDDKYSKILLHVNTKTGKMVKMDVE